MILTPRPELDARLNRLQAHLAQGALDGALFHGITNLFYYTGTAQQAHLWVPAIGEPTLLVRRVLERARRESPLGTIEPLTSLKQLPTVLGQVGRIGMELDILPVTAYAQYQRLFPNMHIVDIGPFTRLTRSIKSAFEVEQIRTAAVTADLTIQDVAAALRPGMTELELSTIAEASQRRNGSQGIVRWRATTGFECPLVAVLAGESALAFSFADTVFGGEGLSPAAPYGAGRRVIERGMPICVDHPIACNGYVHDQTRTLCIGPLDPELQRAHSLCQAILNMIRQEAKPGVTGEWLWQKSLDMAIEAGLGDHFMGYGGNGVKFVGHGVGLELDELPVLAPRQDLPLAVGNVIAVEPKLFFPGKGAVGLESTFLITAHGAESLSVTSEEPILV